MIVMAPGGLLAEQPCKCSMFCCPAGDGRLSKFDYESPQKQHAELEPKGINPIAKGFGTWETGITSLARNGRNLPHELATHQMMMQSVFTFQGVHHRNLSLGLAAAYGFQAGLRLVWC